MPAGSKIRGTDGVISVTRNGTTEEIPMLSSWTLETAASVNEDDTAVMLSNDDGGSSAPTWTESTVSTKNWSVSAEHFWQEDDSVGTTGLYDATEVGVELDIVLFPNGRTTGSVQYAGKVFLESISTPSESSGFITQSVSLKGTGALVKGTVA